MREDKHVNLPLKEFLVNKNTAAYANNTKQQHRIENMIDSQSTARVP